MADVARLLEALHPMREPPPPEAVAPSLLLLTLGCLVALAIAGTILFVRRRRGALRRSAEAMLSASRSLDLEARLAAQASLLRRFTRALAGDEAARGQGGAWLATLDRTFDTRFFTEGAGAVYGDRLYRRPEQIDIEDLDRTLLGLFAKVRA
jgi:hypothetical protein